MRSVWLAAVALTAVAGAALTGVPLYAATANTGVVELELMTWPEVKAALAAGKTTALIYTGGVEQRGPQNAVGGHNLMARNTVRQIAERLGNAIAMPVIPLSPILEQMAEDSITNGFKNVVLMGDSGGGQGPNGVYASVAKKLDEKYKGQGIRVVYADEVYTVANASNGKLLMSEGYPRGTHGGVSDTSIMMYYDTENKYVRRDLLPTAVGDPVLERGQKRPEGYKPVNNGISGDARRANVEIGKRAVENKVNVAVAQIRALLAPAK
jgi:creatinine amidohydrolase/Fe(II)-dependent formamide hydrolase-like protein